MDKRILLGIVIMTTSVCLFWTQVTAEIPITFTEVRCLEDRCILKMTTHNVTEWLMINGMSITSTDGIHWEAVVPLNESHVVTIECGDRWHVHRVTVKINCDTNSAEILDATTQYILEGNTP